MWSIGIGYDSHVVPVLQRVASLAGDETAVAATDAVLAVDPLPQSTFRSTCPDPDRLAAVTSSHRTSSRSGILKTEAALRYADVLAGFEIDT